MSARRILSGGGWLAIALALSACHERSRPAPEPSARVAASSTASAHEAEGSVEASDPPAPPDPTDPDGRAARILIDQMDYGWVDPALAKRYTDTASMQRLDADCKAQKPAACAVAAHGYADRELFRIARERATVGCKLDDPLSCAYLVTAATFAVDQGAFDYGSQPGEPIDRALDRRKHQVCDAGIGVGCYLIARSLTFTTPKLAGNEETFGWNTKACALDCVEGCRQAVQQLAVGSQKNAPDRATQVARVGSLIERVCRRRAGACAELAHFFDDAGPGALTLAPDPQRKRRLLAWGCDHKDDPTYREATCKDLEAMGPP